MRRVTPRMQKRGAICRHFSARLKAVRALLFGALVLPAAIVHGEPRVTLRPHREPVLASAAEAKVKETIDGPVTVDFAKTPLGDALSYIGALEGLEFQYDENVNHDKRLIQEVTLSLKDFPLRILLKMLLLPVALDFEIRDDKLVITTPESAAGQLSVWKYDVGDLTAAGIPADDLAATIVAAVAPHAWEQSGGKGTVGFDNGAMVVRQTRQIHRNVHRLLRDIRQHLSETEAEAVERNARFVTKSYDVGDLVGPRTSESNFIREFEDEFWLSKWKRWGGKGTIKLIRTTMEVANEQWVHDRLGHLLELLGNMGFERGLNGSVFDNQVTGNLAKAARIVQEVDEYGDWPRLPLPLDEPISIDIAGFPVINALSYLSHAYGFSYRLPDEVRKDRAIFKTGVTLVMKDIPLRSAIDRVIAPLNLDWCVEDPTRILVATPEVCAAHRDAQV
jgi:hypothetical protein